MNLTINLKDFLDSAIENINYNTEKLIGKDDSIYNSGEFCPVHKTELRFTKKENVKTGNIDPVYYCFECDKYYRLEYES